MPTLFDLCIATCSPSLKLDTAYETQIPVAVFSRLKGKTSYIHIHMGHHMWHWWYESQAQWHSKISTLSALTQFQRWYHVTHLVAGRFLWWGFIISKQIQSQNIEFIWSYQHGIVSVFAILLALHFPPFFCKRGTWGQQICVEHWVSMSLTLGKMLRTLEEERRWGTTENRRGESGKRSEEKTQGEKRLPQR